MDAETGSVTQNRRIIKVQLVGSFATGKSSFFNQVQAIFPPVEPYSSFDTPTDMMFLPEIRVGGQEWQVRLSDTNGQERFYSTPSSCLRDATAVLIMYRTDKLQSFSDVRNFWLEKILQYNSVPPEFGPVLLLLGNQWREAEQTEVTQTEVDALCSEFPPEAGPIHIASHRLIDTRSGQGVQESMAECAARIRALLSRCEDIDDPLSLTGTVDLSVRSYTPGDLYRPRDRHCCAK